MYDLVLGCLRLLVAVFLKEIENQVRAQGHQNKWPELDSGSYPDGAKVIQQEENSHEDQETSPERQVDLFLLVLYGFKAPTPQDRICGSVRVDYGEDVEGNGCKGKDPFFFGDHGKSSEDTEVDDRFRVLAVVTGPYTWHQGA